MKDNANDNTDDSCLPGGLIPAEQWTLPQTSVRRSLKGAVRNALRQLRAEVPQAEKPFQSVDELPELSAAQQRRLAPEPEYADQAVAIAYGLENARTEGSLSREVVCLVAPPFSGLQQALVLSDAQVGAGNIGGVILRMPRCRPGRRRLWIPSGWVSG